MKNWFRKQWRSFLYGYYYGKNATSVEGKSIGQAMSNFRQQERDKKVARSRGWNV